MTKFKDFSGRKIEDVTLYVKNHMKEYPHSEVFVGSDSHVHGNRTVYAVVICLYNVGKGAHVIYAKETEPTVDGLYRRLWGEVERTILVASELRKGIGAKIDTHFDVNPDEKFGSHVVYKAAVGYAQGAGFNFEVKPHSFAASVAADRLC